MAGRKAHWSRVSGSPSVGRQSRLLGGENRREEKKEERETGGGRGKKAQVISKHEHSGSTCTTSNHSFSAARRFAESQIRHTWNFV